MVSVLARMADWALRLSGTRRQFASEQALAAHLRAKRRGPALPSRRLCRRLSVTSSQRDGFAVYTLAPKERRGAGRILYCHGGAYVAEIAAEHWRFVGCLVDRLGLSVTVPLYPLAPSSSCAEIGALMLAVYGEVLSDGGPVVLMGDSAGGGLAASLALQVVQAGLAPPVALVLLSPWLDVTMTDPEQAALEAVDGMLMRPGLQAAGRWYAGPLSTSDPRVSPLFGDLRLLPPVLMFCGTHDLLVRDARRLVLRARAAGQAVAYHEVPGLMHGYATMFFRESRQARDEICRYLRRRIGPGGSIAAEARTGP